MATIETCEYTEGHDGDYWSECSDQGLFLEADHMPDGESPFTYCPYCGKQIEVAEVDDDDDGRDYEQEIADREADRIESQFVERGGVQMMRGDRW